MLHVPKGQTIEETIAKENEVSTQIVSNNNENGKEDPLKIQANNNAKPPSISVTALPHTSIPYPPITQEQIKKAAFAAAKKGNLDFIKVVLKTTDTTRDILTECGKDWLQVNVKWQVSLFAVSLMEEQYKVLGEYRDKCPLDYAALNTKLANLIPQIREKTLKGYESFLRSHHFKSIQAIHASAINADSFLQNLYSVLDEKCEETNLQVEPEKDIKKLIDDVRKRCQGQVKEVFFYKHYVDELYWMIDKFDKANMMKNKFLFPLYHKAKEGYRLPKKFRKIPYEKCRQLLVDANLDVNSVDEYGNTLLHYAVANDQGAIAEYLLQNGANPGKENIDKISARQLVALSKNKDVKAAFYRFDPISRPLEKTPERDALKKDAKLHLDWYEGKLVKREDPSTWAHFFCSKPILKQKRDEYDTLRGAYKDSEALFDDEYLVTTIEKGSSKTKRNWLGRSDLYDGLDPIARRYRIEDNYGYKQDKNALPNFKLLDRSLQEAFISLHEKSIEQQQMEKKIEKKMKKEMKKEMESMRQEMLGLIEQAQNNNRV